MTNSLLKTLVFSITLIVLYFFLPVVFFSAGTLIIGGVILNGILGGVSGKVGPVVGGKWKQTDYLRSYVIPANPNSAAQQIQRGKMAQAVIIARQLKGSLIDVYWNPFQSAMSGFNAWMKENVSLLASTTNYLSTSAVMAKGNVLPIVLADATYDTATGTIEFAWSNNQNGTTGLSTDVIFCLAITKDGTLLMTADTELRSTISETLNTTVTGLTAADILIFAFAHRGTGSALVVSNSNGIACVAI